MAMSDLKKETAERISTERLEKMLAGLQGVTRGPYAHSRKHDSAPVTGPNYEVGAPDRGVAGQMHALDAAHFARCDPDTMRLIITELLTSRNAHAQEGGEVEAARAAMEELANLPLGISLEDWCRLSAPILAALNPRKETVGVKELEWRACDKFPAPTWMASTPFGFYEIEERSGSDVPCYAVEWHSFTVLSIEDSLEEAKAAAQADYERRILAALSPQSGSQS